MASEAVAPERRARIRIVIADDHRLVLSGLRAALADAGYAGDATVEQDRRPDTPGDPAADLRRSVERLRAAGLG